ncbi:MAG TPA: hypothetical protein VGE08_21600 [Steroidobacter sp.]|uniref:hypothetical protein n=1 Tax=Steroidobacter sp. TaxID=1978227 RepID=UPI002ED9A4D6
MELAYAIAMTAMTRAQRQVPALSAMRLRRGSRAWDELALPRAWSRSIQMLEQLLQRAVNNDCGFRRAIDDHAGAVRAQMQENPVIHSHRGAVYGFWYL